MLLGALLTFLLAVATVVTASVVLSRVPEGGRPRATLGLSLVVIVGGFTIVAAFVALLIAFAGAIMGDA